jgi:NAD(P)-dependent dehydrogenase (short-subunit alcohol dehydrogenase family)
MTSGVEVSLVIGGSRGIGRACVDSLRERGDLVAVTSRGTTDVGHLNLTHDLVDTGRAQGVVETVEAELGPVTNLAMSAAIGELLPLARASRDHLCRTFETNLLGPMWLLRCVIRRMIPRHRGRIVLISSIAPSVGVSAGAAYSASKGGVSALTRSLAREVGPFGVTVNAIEPGIIRTAMTETQPWFDDAAASVPLRRVGEPTDVAPVVCFLLSSAAGYVNGAAIPVDGGLGMGR